MERTDNSCLYRKNFLTTKAFDREVTLLLSFIFPVKNLLTVIPLQIKIGI